MCIRDSNYGAKRYDRVRHCFRFTTVVSAVYASCVCLATLLFPEFFIRLFNADPALVEAGVPALRLYFCLFFMLSLQMAGQYSFVALGKLSLIHIYSPGPDGTGRGRTPLPSADTAFPWP